MSAKQLENSRTDNDMAWKEVLNDFFKDFLQFFWPRFYQNIDWTKPYEILEQELMPLGVRDKVGKKYIDKLFKAYLKGAAKKKVLAHIEVQHTKDRTFSERMYLYHSRLFGRYRQAIVSLAVLGDKNKSWRPCQYKQEYLGLKTVQDYKVIKLLDFKSKTKVLKAHSNPFGLISAIQLTALDTRPKDERRLWSKLELLKCLYDHAWPMEKSIRLYIFLDTILNLSPKLELQYLEKAEKIEGKYDMKLMSTLERRGLERGIQQGIQQGVQQGVQQGERTTLERLLQFKFKSIPAHYYEQITQAKSDTLLEWCERTLSSQTLEEVFESKSPSLSESKVNS